MIIQASVVERTATEVSRRGGVLEIRTAPQDGPLWWRYCAIGAGASSQWETTVAGACAGLLGILRGYASERRVMGRRSTDR